MAKHQILIVVETQDEPLTGDYAGQELTPAFISEYLENSLPYTLPGVTSVEHVHTISISPAATH